MVALQPPLLGTSLTVDVDFQRVQLPEEDGQAEDVTGWIWNIAFPV